jgi:hypothetical protein
MTEFHPTAGDNNALDKELEEINLRKMAEEAKRAREVAEANRIFEGLAHRIKSGKALFALPPPSPSPGDSNNNFGDGNKAGDEPLDLADELIRKYNFVTVNSNKEIYYYDSAKGVYVPNGDVLIESELESRYVEGLKVEGNSKLSRKSIDELIGHIQRRTYIDTSGCYMSCWQGCRES